MFPITLPSYSCLPPRPSLLAGPHTSPKFILLFSSFSPFSVQTSHETPKSILDPLHPRWERLGKRRANVSTCTSTTKSDSSQCMCFGPRSYWSSGVYMMPHSVLNSYGLLAAAMMRFEMFTVILWNRGRVMEIDGLGWESWVISGLKQPAAARLWL